MEMKDRASELLSLEGKVGVVTGGGSGIGRAICTRLAEMGAAVAVLDINRTNGEAAASELRDAGKNARFIECDVRSVAACKAATESVIQSFGKIDILCNNAGVAIRKSVVDLEEAEWDLALDVTLKGIYTLSHHVIPHMIQAGGGAVINTASGWSLKGGARAASYCAAKGGVLNLTRAMAIDHGPHNIRVNCVCPGDTDTPMLRSECQQLGEDREQFMREAANRPLARLGTPEDVANAVLYLASPMASWVTGAYLIVDGGGLA
ncbi:MAG TPA: SDR family oxidoreductase [Acidisarcina sp.]|nr:SDR family oxidoreductase [Acidisarcina sp.]